jgi:hypothetical protein
MRLIDADVLKDLILKERDAIPKTIVERYAFGVASPNHHGNSMRGGIRKALRCMEQTPTIDPESLRPVGQWDWKHRHKGGFHKYTGVDEYGETHTITVDERFECNEPYCPNCGKWNESAYLNYCPNCGAKMEG